MKAETGLKTYTLSLIVWIFSDMGMVSLERPNILYILADDMGFNDVSWTNPSIHTPVLENLARDGVILSQFYTQPKCSPSRSALMTGRYPYKISTQRGSIGPFRPTGLATVFPTLPELLKRQGYSTHLVGKWHLGYCHQNYTPTRRGFDTFFGNYAQQADHYTRIHEVNQHIGSGYDLRRGDEVSHDGEGMYSTDLWAREVTDLLDRRDQEKPFYILMSLTAVHRPFQVPDRFIKMYQKKRRIKGKKYTEEEDMEIMRKAMITAIDENVGKVMEKLRMTETTTTR